jgi:hypothetical protein
VDYHLDFSPPVRALLSRVEQLGSRRALPAMTDTELELWRQACETMSARPARASSAQRTWRQLLADATSEQAVRRTRR